MLIFLEGLLTGQEDSQVSPKDTVNILISFLLAFVEVLKEINVSVSKL